MLRSQPYGVAVSGSYAYVAAHVSKSLVVIDISNPASPVIRGSVVSSSLLDGVRVTQSRVRPPSIMLASAAPPPAYSLSRSHSCALIVLRSHVLCAQATAVAVSGSYAYVTGFSCDSLVVIDISIPASPVIRGSVVSSSLMNQVREAWSCGPGSFLRRCVRPVYHARTSSAAPPPLILSRALTRSPSRAALTALWCRRQRFLRLRGGACFQVDGGDRH